MMQTILGKRTTDNLVTDISPVAITKYVKHDDAKMSELHQRLKQNWKLEYALDYLSKYQKELDASIEEFYKERELERKKLQEDDSNNYIDIRKNLNQEEDVPKLHKPVTRDVFESRDSISGKYGFFVSWCLHEKLETSERFCKAMTAHHSLFDYYRNDSLEERRKLLQDLGDVFNFSVKFYTSPTHEAFVKTSLFVRINDQMVELVEEEYKQHKVDAGWTFDRYTWEHSAPAGKYYVGDLGHVVSNRNYYGILGKYNWRGGFYKKGDSFMMLDTTDGGDGELSDDEGNTYAIESGSIGVCSFDLVDPEKLKELNGNGHIFSFKHEVSIDMSNSRARRPDVYITDGSLCISVNEEESYSDESSEKESTSASETENEEN